MPASAGSMATASRPPNLVGSDYPYLHRDLAVSCREHIEASPKLTYSERTAVLGGTATKLILRLASLRSQTLRQAS